MRDPEDIDDLEMTAGDRVEDDEEGVLCTRELESICSLGRLAAASPSGPAAAAPAAAAAAAAASSPGPVDLQSVLPFVMLTAASTSISASSFPSATDIPSLVSSSTLTLLLLLFSSIFFLL